MLDGSLRPAAGCRPRGLAGAEGSGPARIKKNPFWHAAPRPRSACTGPTPPFKLPRVLLTGAERKQAWLVIARPEETRSYGYWAYNNSTSDEPLRRVNSMPLTQRSTATAAQWKQRLRTTTPAHFAPRH